MGHKVQSLDDPIANLLVCVLVYAVMQACVQVCMCLYSVLAWSQVSVQS